jgi:hypothetical protein
MAQQASIRSPCPDKAADQETATARPVKTRAVLTIAVFVISIIGIALGAVESSWAHRMFSHAAVPGLAAGERTELSYQQSRSKDPFRRDADDYVEGLAKRGITSIPGYRPTPVMN